MASEEQVRDFVEGLNIVEKLASEKEMLIRNPAWGAITFEIIERDIETVFWLVEVIKKFPIDIIPDEVIYDINKFLIHICKIFIEIREFNISQNDPVNSRDQIAGKFLGEVRNAMSKFGIWLPILLLRTGEIESNLTYIENFKALSAKALQDSIEYADTKMDEMKKIMAEMEETKEEMKKAARVAAGEAGAAEFTHEFREEAGVGERKSKRWLWPTGIFSASALALAVMLMLGLLGKTPSDTWEAVYGLGGRIIAISVLFYAAVWSGRIVLANMHLASVNKHRAVSIQTLQAFLKAAEDPAARDAVVLEAARAVYENVPSGYIGRQAAEGGAGGRTLELIRSARAGQAADGA